MTIELAALLPVIALTFILSVWGGFYFHDKSIIAACAYETAVTGSVKAREEWVTAEILEQEFYERIRGKCILMTNIRVKVQVLEEVVSVEAHAEKRNMGISVKQTAAITRPEEYIRKRTW